MIDTGSKAPRSKRSAKAMFRGGCAIAALIGSAAIMTPAQAQMGGRPGGMIVENIPHARPGTMIVENIPHAPPSNLGLEDIRISAPALVPGLDQPQATGPRISASQAFQANVASSTAAVNVSTTANADVVTISSAENIITWSPLDTANSDDAINILPDGTGLTFVGPSSGYTILNRILPSGVDSSGDPRAIAFGGDVRARLGASDGSIGGNIWFYSPGGIVIGSTASFDVGSLVLTTNEIDTSGGLFGSDGQIRFRGAADSSAAIVIESGARIDALNEDSYVALVAPRVVQGGTVTVNGSTAYIAAEQADLTINEGLFDIVVTVGTTDANGIVHTGTTTGPAEVPTPAGPGGIPPATADPHAAYLVAVAKNDAVTMLVSGNLGYTAAVGAAQEDGEIILSGGYNVFAGGSSDDPEVILADGPVNANAVNVEFGGADLTLSNDMTGQTTGAIDLTFSGATFDAQEDLALRSAESIGLTLGNGGLAVGGNLVLDVSATGATDLAPGSNGENASGGAITLDVGDGGILSAGNINLLAHAAAGLGVDSAGTATGGTIDISLSGTGAITTGIMLVNATAIDATDSSNLTPQIGGDSVGGTINLDVSGGALTVAQLTLDTSATAALGSSSLQASNDASAGTISASFTGGTHAVDFLTLQSSAQTATSFDSGGTARDGVAAGGTVSLLVDGATLTIANSLRIDANTDGQTPMAAASAVSLTVRNSATLDILNDLDISTSASGGNLGVENWAGTIDILADAADLTFDDLSLNAFSLLGDFGGSEPADGAAGGAITITATGGGQIVGDGFASIDAGANGTTGSDGATGLGGTIVFDANGGTIQIGGTSFIDASGVGNSNSDPADLANRGLGTGGTITYRIRNAGTMSFANVFANSDGSVQFNIEGGGIEPVGEGGLGIGGQVVLDLIDGTFTANSFNIGANGSGGPGGGDIVSLPTFTAPAPFDLDYSSRPAGFLPASVAPFALPVDPGANGGGGTGGTVTFNLDGGTATLNNLTISANGIGGAGGDGNGDAGIGAGDGGNGLGGAATFNAVSGSLTVTNTLTVTANGTGGNGGYGDGTDAGSGGNGQGGTATFDLDGSATIDASIVLVTTNGTGGNGDTGGQSFGGLDGGVGGDGGTGTGGDATFNNTAGTISFASLTAQSTGTGGDGGSNVGFSIGDAVDDGGAGGDGIGGTATINLNQDDLTDPVYTVEANGVGGSGGSGLDAGDGGNAFGGTAALNVNNAQVQLDDPTVRAIATGGSGSFSDGVGGDGGNGGNATGGVARIEVSGANGSIPITFVILESDGTGGDGGSGSATAFGLGGTAGNGGSGGDGSGGSSELVARTGGILTIANAGFSVSSTGLGGSGGSGGNIDMVGGGIAGDGGDGGQGTGGSPTLLAQGGTIAASDISLTGAGTGGDGGAGGTDLVVQVGADGNGGHGVGGNPVIEVQEGSPGIMTLGATSMLANGTGGSGANGGSSLGGRIEIVDTSTDPAGLITMDSLTASALTGSSGASSGFFLTGNSGPIAVAGDVTVNVGGNAEFAFDGDGQMTVGGNMVVVSGASILVSHSNNGAPTDSLDIAGAFTATAQRDFNAAAGSRIASGDATDIRAEGNALAADLTASGRIDLSAGQDTTLGNGVVTGGPLAEIRIDAGSDDDPTNPLYDPQYSAAITGTVSSTGNVRIFAGGNAIFRSGSATGADNRIDVQTGDDIIVESGATVSAGLNPNTAPNPADPFGDQAILNLDAGGLGPSLLSPIVSPISSIILAGTLEAANTAVVLNADAVDGLGGTIAASSISADIGSAPPNGVVQSDDNGLLSANCLEGNICLGTLGADNRVEIGQSGVPIGVTIEGGNVAASAILITARRDLVVGTNGVVSIFDGSSEILFESTEGNIELRGASISSDLLQISAASGSLLGTGSLISANDVGITVAGDISAASISAGRELTTVANIGGVLEGAYSVPGSIDVGTFSQGVGDANIDAGGNIVFGQVDVSAGNDIILLAPGGDVFLGATAGAANISIFGVNVEIGSIGADDLIDIGASADISGNDAAAGGDIGVTAGGSIDLASLDAGGALTADAGGSIALTDGSAGGDIQLSASDIGADALSAATMIDLQSGGGVSLGTADAGSDILIDAGASVTAGTIDAAGDVTVAASGAIGVTSLDGGFVDLASGAVLAVDAVNALRLDATASVLDFGDIALSANGLATSGSADLTATAGAISVDTLDAAGNAALTATGDIGFTTLTAGGSVSADSGGSLRFTSVSGEAIDFAATVMIAGTSATTPANTGIANDIAMDAGGIIDIGTVSANGDVTLDADGTVSVDTLSGQFLAVTSGQAINLGSIAGLALDATGASIDFGDAAVTDSARAGSGAVTLAATSGNIDFSRIDAAGDIDMTAAGAIRGTAILGRDMLLAGADGIDLQLLHADGQADLRSVNGAIVVRADVRVADTFVARGGAILLNALGELAISDVRATNGDIDVVAAGDLTVEQALSSGNIALTSSSGFVTAGNMQAGQTNGGPANGNPAGNQTPFGSVVGSPGPGDISVTAATDAVIASDVVAANALFISAGGSIDIQALATGATVETSSADLDIGTAGQLGTSDRTQDIYIASIGTNAITLGGPATSAAFTIDAAEFGRIHSGGDLSIVAAAVTGAGPSLIVEDLDVAVASGAGGPQDGTIGTSGALMLVTEGSTRINGALALTGATAGNALTLLADQEIRVDANGGNIAIVDANGGLAGQLNLTAQTIIAATDAAADNIAGATVADADIRLADNDGIDRDDGFFQADGITFTVGSGLYIQNSAAGTDFADRRGFVVGDNGVTIAGPAGGAVAIVANGVQRLSSGTVITGIDMIAQTTISTGFAAASTINGCLIASPASCAPPPPPPPPPPPQDTPERPGEPVQDLVEEEIEEQPEAQQPTTPLIETVEIRPNREGPLIDDPVTGSGNDDLWIRNPVSGGSDD